MNHIEKLLKKRFDNGRSEDGVKPDELWAEISPLIPAETTKLKIGGVRHLVVLLLLFLSVAGMGVYSYYWSSSRNGTATDDTTYNHEKVSQPDTPVPSKLIPESENNLDLPNESHSPTLQGRLDSTGDQPTSPAASITLPLPTTSYSSTNDVENQTSDIHTTTTQESTSVEAKGVNLKKTAKRYINNEAIATLPLPFLVQSNQTNVSAAYSVSPEGSKPFSPTIKSVQLGLFSGINLWKNQFPSATPVTEQLTEANEYLLGSTFAAELQLKLNDHLGIISGIAYNKTHHQFNLTRTWDTLMYRNNIPGSDLINARATRTVKNYNSLYFLSVPILINSRTSFGHTTIGIDVGITLNYVTRQNGKTLNADSEIITYPTTESAQLPYSDFFIAYQLRPFVGYQLSDKISFQLRSIISLQQFGQSDIYDTKHRALLWGLSFGGLYSL